MKGLVIKLHNQNLQQGKSQNHDSTYLSMHVIAWKGCAIKKSLTPAGSSKRPEEYPYKVSRTVEDHRIFSILMLGNADSVDSLKFQLSLRAPQATAENISFGSQERVRR